MDVLSVREVRGDDAMTKLNGWWRLWMVAMFVSTLSAIAFAVRNALTFRKARAQTLSSKGFGLGDATFSSDMNFFSQPKKQSSCVVGTLRWFNPTRPSYVDEQGRRVSRSPAQRAQAYPRLLGTIAIRPAESCLAWWWRCGRSADKRGPGSIMLSAPTFPRSGHRHQRFSFHFLRYRAAAQTTYQLSKSNGTLG